MSPNTCDVREGGIAKYGDNGDRKDPLAMSCFAMRKLFAMFTVNDTPSIMTTTMTMMMTVTISSWFIKSGRASHRKKCCKP